MTDFTKDLTLYYLLYYESCIITGFRVGVFNDVDELPKCRTSTVHCVSE